MRTSQGAALILMLGTSAAAIAEGPPPQGFVPTAEVAIKIAEAVAVPVFGQEMVGAELPLKATLESGVWRVEGADNSKDTFGGVLEITLSQKDGRIISIEHGE